jgi:hypothetical protein
MSLQAIQPTRKTMPRRLIIHGVKGVGKSTFASHAPSCVFVPAEDGLANIEAQAFPLAQTWSEFIGNVLTLDSEHQFRTVAIDSLDQVERLIWDDVCKQHGKKSIEEFGYGKGYVLVLAHWRKLFAALDSLRMNRKMMSICIGHTEIKKFDNPEGDAFDRYQLRLNKHASALASEWCDDMLFAHIPIRLKSSGTEFDGTSRKVPLNNTERVLRTRETPTAEAKNRIPVEIPDEIPMAWSEYAKYAFAKPQPESENTDG